MQLFPITNGKDLDENVKRKRKKKKRVDWNTADIILPTHNTVIRNNAFSSPPTLSCNHSNKRISHQWLQFSRQVMLKMKWASLQKCRMDFVNGASFKLNCRQWSLDKPHIMVIALSGRSWRASHNSPEALGGASGRKQSPPPIFFVFTSSVRVSPVFLPESQPALMLSVESQKGVIAV